MWMQLTEAGIPAWQILADKMKITTAQVMKMSEKGLIPADKAIQALIEGMNKRFPDMMEKQSKSLAGLWSTMHDTFDNKILVKFGDGIASALKPRFDALGNWINNNGATIDRWGATIQRVTGAAADSVARKFESAFNFVKTRYLDNPDFMKIKDVEGKVKFAFDDLQKTFDTYYEKDGKTQLQGTTSKIIGEISGMIAASSSQIGEIGVTLGSSLAAGMLTGLEQFAKENTKMAALMAFISTPGPVAIKSAAAAAVVATSAENKATKYLEEKGIMRSPEEQHQAAFGLGKKVKQFFGFGDSAEGSQSYYAPKPKSSNAGGLDRVPYNGYVLTAHKDERIQTKAEADAYRSNRGGVGGGITIAKIADSVIIREDADIDKIAHALATEIRRAQEAGVYAG